MKRRTLTQLLAVGGLIAMALVVAMTSQSAAAHVLESNNGIGAVIHIDPDDDPIAGENSTFYFEFKDTANKLSLSECDCSVTIKRGDEAIGTEKMRVIRPLSGAIEFTFPQRDIYTVEVAGRPLQPDAFASFNFSYSFRVTRGENLPNGVSTNAPQAQGNNPYLTIGLVLAVLLAVGLAATIVYNSWERDRKQLGRKAKYVVKSKKAKVKHK